MISGALLQVVLVLLWEPGQLRGEVLMSTELLNAGTLSKLAPKSSNSSTSCLTWPYHLCVLILVVENAGYCFWNLQFWSIEIYSIFPQDLEHLLCSWQNRSLNLVVMRLQLLLTETLCYGIYRPTLSWRDGLGMDPVMGPRVICYLSSQLEMCDYLLLGQYHQASPTVEILQGLAAYRQPHSLSRKGSHNSPPTNTFYYCCLKWSAICHPSVWFNKLYALRINLQFCQGSKYFDLICSFNFRAVNLPSDPPFRVIIMVQRERIQAFGRVVYKFTENGEFS